MSFFVARNSVARCKIPGRAIYRALLRLIFAARVKFAGATITPRAVVAAVHASLKFFAGHRERLLAAPAGTAAATLSAAPQPGSPS